MVIATVNLHHGHTKNPETAGVGFASIYAVDMLGSGGKPWANFVIGTTLVLAMLMNEKFRKMATSYMPSKVKAAK